MSNYIETSTKGFPANGAIGQYLRVLLSGTQLAIAGAGDLDVGTIEQAAFNAGDMRAVRLRTAQGTTPMVASGAITLYAPVYGAAAGKITATANNNFIGIALKAASGNNSVIEVLRLHQAFAPLPGELPVEAHTANYSVVAADCGKVLTNDGAAGEVDFALPAAVVGMYLVFALSAAQTVKVLPNGTDVMGTPSTSTVPATGVMQAASKGCSAAAIGASLELVCVHANQWTILSSVGNWTAGV